MSVYVDNMRARLGRMIMSHLVADSTSELMAMVDRIGIARRWIQHKGTYKEHFDISQSKRALAIAAGAIPVTAHELGLILKAKKEATLSDPPTTSK